MELPENFTVYLITQPQQASIAGRHGFLPACQAYRIGGGPHLFRAQSPVSARGGIMVVDNRGFDGLGNPEPFCQEVLRECAARGFQGVLWDLEGPALPVLRRALEYLAPGFQRRRWTAYVPERYALDAPSVKVVVPTALSGGSLRQRLTQAVEQYGADRIALGLEWVAEDFTLPAPEGAGIALSWEELENMVERYTPSIYFSNELCAHYFTYMRTGQNAHFVLYDDPASMAKKLQVAAALGIREGFLPHPKREDYLDALSPAGI